MWHLVLHLIYAWQSLESQVYMSINNSFSHLTLYERRIILTGITSDSSKTDIAQTIGKEIKLHRSLSYKCNMPFECINYRKCVYGRECTTDCPECIPFKCSRRDRSPGKFQKRNPMSIKREPTENISVAAPIRITKHIWIKILMLLSFKKQIKIRLF